MLNPESSDIFSFLHPPPEGWSCSSCGKPIDWPGACEPCGAKKERQYAARFSASAIATIPRHFRWATFDSEALGTRCQPEALEKAKNAATMLARGNTRVLILAGCAGAGKTSLACAIMRELLCETVGRSARFVGCLPLSRARADSSLGRTPPLVDESIRASLLVLDDLGQEVQREVVQEVIHARHDDDAPMVVTTGFHPKTFAERYGAGTARRLTEHAKVIGVRR